MPDDRMLRGVVLCVDEYGTVTEIGVAGTAVATIGIAEWPAKLIQNWFNLTEQQISDVIEYITLHRDEVEYEYQLVVQQADDIRAYWQERNRERFAALATMPPKPGQEAVVAKLRARKAELGLS